MFKPVATAEQVMDALFAECEYWRKVGCEGSIGAVGALSNVIAFATVPGFRADWHPKKTAPANDGQPAKTTGPWLRFMFRLADVEAGKLGRVLAGLFGQGLAFHFEPWPEDDCAVYVKAEAGNRGIVLELASGAGLVPVSVTEVSGI